MAQVPAVQADVASYYDERSLTFQTHQETFLRLLESPELDYRQKVAEMLKSGKRRLLVNLPELSAGQRNLFFQIQQIPIQFIAPFQRALQQFIRENFDHDPSLMIDPRYKYSIGFTGLETDNNLTPRDLKSATIGRLLCVEGIATKCSLVRAKVGQSTHYCDATNIYSTSYYHDNTSLTGPPTSTIFPTKDENGNPLSTEFGLSYFYNTQSIGLQEMPEKTPQGLLPCSINVILNDDLVDSCKPGDRIRMTGVYRALPSYSSTYENSGIFGSIFIALHVEKVEHKLKSTSVNDDEARKIRQFARRPDCLKILSQSIAPSIYGHSHIKRALLLLLLGGTEKNLDTGTHIRGDINVLMVGDPSTAKSQLLRFVLHLAPLAINTTGRGSSGVGLTASIVHDKDSGEKRLEAGAMVLADRGVVCIDEFDKMNEMDRVAIHEVMEQQTVTISKAGVHMSLNSRCSVVAAANPIYGQYDINLKPHVNVGLQDSLLSRFDLLFIVLDRPIASLDRSIASKVLDNHMRTNTVNGSLDEDQPFDPADTTTIQSTELQVYVNDGGDIGNGGTGEARVNSPQDKVTIDFLRKYIAYAKGLTIVLSDQACEYIAARYAEIRQRARLRDDSSLPITARLLETLIRLSVAVTKSRLGGVVTRHDARIAYKLLKFGLNAAEQINHRPDHDHEVNEDDMAGGDDDDDDDDDSDDDGDDGDRRGGKRDDDLFGLRHDDDNNNDDDMYFEDHDGRKPKPLSNPIDNDEDWVDYEKNAHLQELKESVLVDPKGSAWKRSQKMVKFDQNGNPIVKQRQPRRQGNNMSPQGEQIDQDDLDDVDDVDDDNDDQTRDEIVDDNNDSLTTPSRATRSSARQKAQNNNHSFMDDLTEEESDEDESQAKKENNKNNKNNKNPQNSLKSSSKSRKNKNTALEAWGSDEYEDDQDLRTKRSTHNEDRVVSLSGSRITTFNRCFQSCGFESGTMISLDDFLTKMNANTTKIGTFSKDELLLIIKTRYSDGDAPFMLGDDGETIIIV
jgi:DNA replication licensing factor MCM3